MFEQFSVKANSHEKPHKTLRYLQREVRKCNYFIHSENKQLDDLTLETKRYCLIRIFEKAINIILSAIYICIILCTCRYLQIKKGKKTCNFARTFFFLCSILLLFSICSKTGRIEIGLISCTLVLAFLIKF